MINDRFTKNPARSNPWKKKTGWSASPPHKRKKGDNHTKTRNKTKNPDSLENLALLWNKFKKKHQKLEELNRTGSSTESDYQTRKEKLKDETRILKTHLYNNAHKLIKKPEYLKKSQMTAAAAGTAKILLDANAVLPLISSYEMLNGIKTLCPRDTVTVYVPKFIKEELKHEHVREKLSYSNVISELNGIFKQGIKDMKFNLKTEKQKIPIKIRYPALSMTDVKCLLYAKFEDAVLITNDGGLKDACAREKVRIIDQYDRKLFSQTTDFNLEDWFVGKIQRMNGYWSELQDLKKSNTVYLEKRNAFKALFHHLILENQIMKTFFIRIYVDGDSLPRKTESFFNHLNEKQDLTLTDIDTAMKKIPN